MWKVNVSAVAAMLNLASGNWFIINDGVMGGKSSSEMAGTETGLRFAGELSLANNGGFASTRRGVDVVPPGTDSIRLELKGDGRPYQLRLRMDGRFDGISWRKEFDTNGEWQTLVLPVEDFEPVFRGYTIAEAGKADPDRIRQVGFLIADKAEGPFSLEVRRLEFFSAADQSQ